MNTNTTKPLANTKPPFGSKAWLTKNYINIVFAVFVALGYVLPFVVDVNQPWVLKFNRFMASICPQVAAIERFGIEVAFNQFYFGLMWATSPIWAGVESILWLRRLKLNHKKRDIYKWLYALLFSSAIVFLGMTLLFLGGPASGMSNLSFQFLFTRALLGPLWGVTTILMLILPIVSAYYLLSKER